MHSLKLSDLFQQSPARLFVGDTAELKEASREPVCQKALEAAIQRPQGRTSLGVHRVRAGRPEQAQHIRPQIQHELHAVVDLPGRDNRIDQVLVPRD